LLLILLLLLFNMPNYFISVNICVLIIGGTFIGLCLIIVLLLGLIIQLKANMKSLENTSIFSFPTSNIHQTMGHQEVNEGNEPFGMMKPQRRRHNAISPEMTSSTTTFMTDVESEWTSDYDVSLGNSCCTDQLTSDVILPYNRRFQRRI